jgi:hypothetical protein
MRKKRVKGTRLIPKTQNCFDYKKFKSIFCAKKYIANLKISLIFFVIR